MKESPDYDVSLHRKTHEREMLINDPKHIDESVGIKLKILRKKRLLTQQNLAKRLGISYQQIQKYETGVNRISAGRLYYLAEILGVDIRYFFPNDDNSGANTVLKARGLNEPIRGALSRLITVISEEVQKS